MGFFDPGFMGLVLMYEAFVYIAAQIINYTRGSWLDRHEANHSSAAKRYLHDFHDSYSIFILLNGWMLAFCALSTAAIAAGWWFNWQHSSLPSVNNRASTLLWGGILCLLTGFTQSLFIKGYASERRDMSQDTPFKRCWPIRTRKQATIG